MNAGPGLFANQGYVETTAELGHWLEVCQLEREDIDFFCSLVSDSS